MGELNYSFHFCTNSYWCLIDCFPYSNWVDLDDAEFVVVITYPNNYKTLECGFLVNSFLSNTYYTSSPNKRVLIWIRNRMRENLLGYSAEEAIGRDVIELLNDSRERTRADEILQCVVKGETWTGIFNQLYSLVH